MEHPYMLAILYGWLSRQGISRHGSDPQSWNIPSPAFEKLIHWGLVTPYIVIIDTVNNDSDNGLVPDGTKPLPKPHRLFIKKIIMNNASIIIQQQCCCYQSLDYSWK